MKKLRTALSLGLMLCFGLSLTAQANDARDIIQKVNNRYDGSSAIQKTKMATCKYGKKGKKIACAEKPRVKITEAIRKDFGTNEEETKNVTIILSPIGEKGIGMLQYDYDEIGKDSDQWLYLSALGKVKRMVSGSEDEPKTGSLFGTEILLEDLEKLHVEDYTYKILKETTYQKRPVWVIESIPTPERARKSNYSKTVSWIDKERFIALKTHYYNRRGQFSKRLTVRNVEQVNGVWVARKLTMNNLLTKRVTNMSTTSIAFNLDVPNNFLTQRTLTDMSFRERILTDLRTQFK